MTPEMLLVTRRFAVGTQITLYKIDLTEKGGGVYHFTNNVFEDGAPISFGGDVYVHYPIHMDEIEVDSQSAPAQPVLSIATSGGPVASLISAYKDLKGAMVYRFKTFAEFLDQRPDGAGGVETNPDADSAAVIGLEMFVIDRKQAANDIFAEFQLTAPTDQEGVQLPLRIVRKRWCDAHYRVYDPDQPDDFFYFEQADGGCPYNGTDYFDYNNEPCTIDKDECSKSVVGCTKRFGSAVALPMQAVPGIKSELEA